MNPMQIIRIEKVTLNIGAGKDQAILNKGIRLITTIAGTAPVKTITRKRIAAWGLRPGLPIGCKLTLRGNAAQELLKRLLVARDNILGESCFDDYGNISFGIPEYIDIPGVNYEPEIGIMGLQVSVTLERPGFRIKKRKIRKQRIQGHHRITSDEAVDYMKKIFSIKVGEEE